MHVDENGYQFTRDEIYALLAFASTDTARRHYACIALAPAKGRALATDGPRVAALHAPGQTASFDEIALVRESLDAVMRAIPKGGQIHIDPKGNARIMNAKGAEVSTFGIECFQPGKDGEPELPGADYVFPFLGTQPAPVREACPFVVIDADYLADLELIARTFGEDSYVNATVHRGAEAIDAVVITMKHWQVVQLPIRPKQGND